MLTSLQEVFIMPESLLISAKPGIYIIQKILDIGKTGADIDVVGGHFADQNIIILLFKGAKTLDFFIDELDIILNKIRRQMASQDEIRIMHKMERIDKLGKRTKIVFPAGLRLIFAAADGFKEDVRVFVAQEGFRGAMGFIAAALSAIA